MNDATQLIKAIDECLIEDSFWFVDWYASDEDAGLPEEYILSCQLPPYEDGEGAQAEEVIHSTETLLEAAVERLGDFIEKHGEEAGSLLRYQFHGLMIIWQRYDDRIGGHEADRLFVGGTLVYDRERDA